MTIKPPHRYRVAAIVMLTAVAAATAVDAQQSCLETRGLVMTANVGPVAVSGHIATVLQHGNWDTRPAIRINRMDRESVHQIGAWQAIWSISDVALAASTAYVIADDKLIALDLSRPDAPVELGSINLVNADRLALAWNRAHVLSTAMDGRPRLDIIGVADPTSLTPMGSLLWELDAPEQRALDADAGFVAVADDAGVEIIDVRDRWNPVRVSRWGNGPVADIALVGRLALAVPAATAPGQTGVRIIDLAQPNRPLERGFWNSPSEVVAVEAFGRQAAVATSGHGIFILDLDDPDSPESVDQWDGYGLGAVDLAAAWPNIAVANTQIGLVVLGLESRCLPPRRPAGRVTE